VTRAARHPAAILLDCLGTLVALERPAPLLVVALRQRLGIAVTEPQAERAIAAEIAYYRAHLDEGRDAPTLADLHRRCAEALRAALPPSTALSGADGAELEQALLSALQFTPYPDAAPALARARERGQRLVVVSNWDVSLHDVLQRVGLRRLLDGVLTSAEAGFRKPSARIFERALALAGVSAAEAIHVGDNLEEDVAGARAAGIEPVLISRDGKPGPQGTRVVASLLEL
jgi:putative hydrolase of the HAD superfamily